MDKQSKSGQGLRIACETRRTELEQVLEFLGKENPSATRTDIESALGSLSELLTGDLDHLGSMTCEQLSRWLASSRHLGLKEQRAIVARQASARPS